MLVLNRFYLLRSLGAALAAISVCAVAAFGSSALGAAGDGTGAGTGTAAGAATGPGMPGPATSPPAVKKVALLSARWTGKDDANADFAHVIDAVNARTGAGVAVDDFLLFEDTSLATSHFRMYVLAVGGLPVKGAGVRIWTDAKSGAAIQVEAQVQSKAAINHLATSFSQFVFRDERVVQNRMMKQVRAVVAASDDPSIADVSSRDEWQNGTAVRSFRVKSRRGVHTLRFALSTLRYLGYDYREFPQTDVVSSPRAEGLNATAATPGELTVPAFVFPIYEVAKNRVQSRVISQLRHLQSQIARVKADPYTPLRYRVYPDSKQDPILGATLEGQAQGYWSMPELKRRAMAIRAELPLSENSFATGLVLEGQFATVNLDPEAKTLLAKAPVRAGTKPFEPAPSTQFTPRFTETIGDDGKVLSTITPAAALLGKPLIAYDDAWSRPAVKYSDNDPVALLNDGFDEVQVYWAIDTLMETLHQMGFTDPELSTRPFNAFLFNPDIAMRDNAFYTDDTINFTTYSPGSRNAARDNSTTWHELGHGVMDRLMGDALVLNDSGGLAEGMADFVAALIIAKVTNGQPFDGQNDFRIVNNTAFFLTNESHDDGEAYGGAMYDFLQLARKQFGESGVVKVADLTLEAMRLSRNHPGLTAPDWFSHMLFADDLGHGAVRAPGELRALILRALGSRNFAMNESEVARFDFKRDGTAVEKDAPGTRNHPITLRLKADERAVYQLHVKAKESAIYKFNYPLKVKLAFNDGALQGAIHWEGEEGGDRYYSIASADDDLVIDVAATAKCDAVNRPDGGCSDYVFVELFPTGRGAKPVGKKRFYVRLIPQPATSL